MNATATETTMDLRPIFASGGTPCAAIDEAVTRINVGDSLILLVPFEPIPLYNKLGRQGFTHATDRPEAGTWRVVFTRTFVPEPGTVESVGCGPH